MTPRSLQAVLRTLADTGPPASDAELLHRFLQNDEAAFAELVTRHGRLVWTVCRTQTRSDAEADDAFQATFLVLLKNAGKVRDGGKLSSWLHGVAFKVCGKARKSADRRTARERATAHREGNGTAVPDSAWDRALAAVHEEVARLPETLRVPFVLCCLEGKGQTEAAEQLGWKLGTLSGRLTRAKDAVLAKLDARGLTLGVAATVGLTIPPAPLLAKAAALIHVGGSVPSSILQLTQGVIGMSMTSVKVLAATVLLACGVGLTVGSGWVATADAQQPKPKADDDKAALEKKIAEMEAIVRKLQAEKGIAVERANRDAAEVQRAAEEKLQKLAAEMAKQAEAKREAERIAQIALGGKGPAPEDTATFKTAKNEYNLIVVSDITQTKFREMVERYESKGWDYCGTTPLVDPKVLVWMFRRPLKAVPPAASYTAPGDKYLFHYAPKPFVEPLPMSRGPADVAKSAADTKAIEDQIAALQAKLGALRATKPAVPSVAFGVGSTPLEPATLAAYLGQLGAKKFDGKIRVDLRGDNVIVTGDKEAIEWAVTAVKALGGK